MLSVRRIIFIIFHSLEFAWLFKNINWESAKLNYHIIFKGIHVSKNNFPLRLILSLISETLNERQPADLLQHALYECLFLADRQTGTHQVESEEKVKVTNRCRQTYYGNGPYIADTAEKRP